MVTECTGGTLLWPNPVFRNQFDRQSENLQATIGGDLNRHEHIIHRQHRQFAGIHRRTS
jgi:hypothetical protein